MPSAPIRLSQQAQRTTEPPINYFIRQAIEKPDLISLAAGLVDEESLPAPGAAQAMAELLTDPAAGRAALQYGTTIGYAPLRDQLLQRTAGLDGVAPSELGLTSDHVVLTTGSQQLLYLLGELLLEPGDLVITEAPSYFVYQGTLESLGARTLTVPMDEDGINTDALEELLARLDKTGEIDRLRMIYVVDYFQNPTGLTLSLPRRQRLMELAHQYSRKHRILILEDAAYRELRYEGPDLPSIKSFDHDNQHVILAMTFSKSCAPGLKAGYGLMPRELVEPLLRIKGNHDFGSSNLVQHLLDRLLASGAYDRHARRLCQVYRRKRDTLLAALNQEFPADGPVNVRWTHPEGGLYVWLTFPSEFNTGSDGLMLPSALEEGVLYVPGEFCYLAGQDRPVPMNEARLCFGVIPEEQIGEGIRRLSRAVKRLQVSSEIHA